MTKTRLNAVIIEQDKSDSDKKYFTNIGSAFIHPDDQGLDLALKAYPTDGKFTLFTDKDDDEGLSLPIESYYPVYVVESVKKDDDSYDNYYHKVGAAFPHDNHKGLNVELFATPVKKSNFKLVLRTPKSE